MQKQLNKPLEQCSGKHIFRWEQLFYSVMEKIIMDLHCYTAATDDENDDNNGEQQSV